MNLKCNDWLPTRTGDYAKDCASGRRFFTDLHATMADKDDPTLLGRVLQAQVRCGEWDGVEIGFAQAMAEVLIAQKNSVNLAL